MDNQLIVSIVSLTFAFLGGCFAFWQWHRSLVYKRTEIVQKLVDLIRCDRSVCSVMDMIDWNKGLFYDGAFHIQGDISLNALKGLTDADIFVMIDQTLSVFNYVCYLKKVHAIKSRDMKFFVYQIRRLTDNPHIANYLYSLYHWTNSLGVGMSFSYIVDYCIKRKYLDKSFKKYIQNGRYKCYLVVNPALYYDATL